MGTHPDDLFGLAAEQRLAPSARWPLGCGPAASTRWWARITSSALGLLDGAKALDLRSPHQDFFNPSGPQVAGWGRPVEIGGGRKVAEGLPLSPEVADDDETRAAS